ncbi:MAG: hypothetical protein JWN43_1710 [Gammaproteobacteria bacterium]|nr:hypothetical protein [Gammaproteobacteria bacterium]
MPTTVEEDPNATGSAGRNLACGASGKELKQLFDSVDELIKRVADVESGDVKKIRAKVRIALMAARSAMQDGASQVRRQARQVGQTTDNYVRGNPWQSVGAATLTGLAIGLLISAD